jgi:hypothetical protein
VFGTFLNTFRGNDLDLFVGGLAEPHRANASVGETFAVIIEQTFQAIRHTDKKWYTDVLSKAELTYLSKLKLGEIIKLNTGVDEIGGENVRAALDVFMIVGCLYLNGFHGCI